MCPDRQIISLYYDEELPSPWKEKMAAHIESCSACRAQLAEYGRLGERLRNEPEEAFLGEAAKKAEERVWKKLRAPESALPEAFTLVRPNAQVRTGWKRSVTIPLPVAAAAVLVVVVSLAFAGLRSGNGALPEDSMAAAGIGLDERGMVPVQNMSEVLQYLSNQEGGDFMTVRLPESRTFSRAGEPALINAADYSRRNTLP